MMICRTDDISKLGSKFIKAKPFSVLLWVVIALILCTLMVVALINTNSPEAVSWIFLITMIAYIIIICRQVARADSYFNAFVLNDNGLIIFINFGNIFMNPQFFGGQCSTTRKFKVIIDWFRAAKRMKMLRNERDFDSFILNNSVLASGHYVKRIFSVKSNRKYIIAKLRLKECNAVQSNMITEFTKTIRIPKKFKNAELLETALRSAMERQSDFDVMRH